MSVWSDTAEAVQTAAASAAAPASPAATTARDATVDEVPDPAVDENLERIRGMGATRVRDLQPR
jgi:predicted flap endonuclease-1-like 5' DNA nuclease